MARMVSHDIMQIGGRVVRSLDQAAAHLFQHPQGGIHLALHYGSIELSNNAPGLRATLLLRGHGQA